MPPFDSSRPRVSHETRLLLATVIVSVSVLWVLARIRFPEQAAARNPIPQVLTQLLPAPGFDDLAATVSRAAPRLAASLVATRIPSPVPHRIDGVMPGLRIRREVAASVWAPLDSEAGWAVPGMLRRDTASGLTLVRVTDGAPSPLESGTVRGSSFPRYLLASDVASGGVSLRPVFIGSVYETASPAWSAPVWAIPVQSDVAPGTILFTMEGALAGVVSLLDGTPILVPGETMLAAADRLEQEESKIPGTLAIEVQPMSPGVAAATGAANGVVITRVEPASAAVRDLSVMDVIEAVNGEPLVTFDQWRVRMARLTSGERLVLRVAGHGGRRDVTVAATSIRRSPPDAPALTMRSIRRTGAEVLLVAPGSGSARAGIQPGDIVTAVGAVQAPTPAQVLRALSEAPVDRPVLLAITRGTSHLVLGVEKRQP